MSAPNSRSTSDIIITITTLIFAITSMVTVYISLSAWNNERESVRPYLTFYNSPEVYLENNYLNFSFAFYNVGFHPAASFHSQTLIVDYCLDDQPLHNDQFTLVNYIPQKTSTDLMIKIDLEPTKIDYDNINPHFIIINLKYTDPILEKNHEQIIFLRWEGITNKNLQPIFHCSKEEKNLILDYIKKF
ncbi:MAG: hypothetical protein APF84_14235 [Gracilibacter sp. BRH_c7a]|nr:MAG: hypothetical protein APF84_14235 [Gracilibacter sp. BRH_c7a]